ncbi:hypothetical protein GOV04_01575 [Candidatus Woesearchaeota archaeon]|nr:hypothetical protein [Candidatus Woesearchaeota archaeon]
MVRLSKEEWEEWYDEQANILWDSYETEMIKEHPDKRSAIHRAYSHKFKHLKKRYERAVQKEILRENKVLTRKPTRLAVLFNDYKEQIMFFLERKGIIKQKKEKE